MREGPIVVLGFGRSGTTWISDIISKGTGGLILFEPFHPCVAPFAETLAYSHDDESGRLQAHLDDLLNKRIREKWLLRNHIPVSLDEVSDHLVNMVWEECTTLGFKEIRANFLIKWFLDNLDAKVVFVIRHPCATIASILRRTRFWLEFGWDKHYAMFLNRTVLNPHYADHGIACHQDLVASASTDIAKQAVMWAVTHAVVLPELDALGLPAFCYEDFYAEPFSSARMLLQYLGHAGMEVHPAHIFTPSMTTMKTLHGIYEYEKILARKGSAFFWEDMLSDEDVAMVMSIVQEFGIGLYDSSGFLA
jgi:hypothetical protein